MRWLASMLVCGLLTDGLLACGRTTRNRDEPEPDNTATTNNTTSSGAPGVPEQPPPEDCPRWSMALGTHVLVAEYGATVVDALEDTALEVTVTPMRTQAGPCSDETELPVSVRVVTSDHVIDASTATGVLGYDEDGGDVRLRTELSGIQAWSQVSFTPSSEASPEPGAPTLEWSERQSAEFAAKFGPSEDAPEEFSGSFDALSWPTNCPHEPEAWRTSNERIEAALEERYAELERHMPVALNWLGGDGAELVLSVTPNGRVCDGVPGQPVLVAADSSDGRVAGVWHARATDADATWLTLDAVVSERVALEERLGIQLDSTGEYDAYGMRLSLRWHRETPMGMLQVLGIDREPCGDHDDEICAEATEIAVAIIGKLGATVAPVVVSRDLAGASGVCPEATLTLAGVGGPLLTGVIENDSSLNIAAVDQCNGGAPRLAIDWEAPHAGQFRFDTHESDYDTVLTLRPLTSGGQCASLTGDACNDDSGEQLTSEVTTTLNEGQRVRVEIATYGGLVQPAHSSRTYRLNITETE